MSKYIFDKHQPWQHQRDVLVKTWKLPYHALLMEYGTGKTYVIIHTAGLLYEVAKDIDALFVIAPNGVHTQWVEEQIPMHLPDRIPHMCRIWESSTSKKYIESLEDFWADKNKDKLKIFSMNVEALQSSEKARNFSKNFLRSFRSLLVIDESTRIKTPGAKRTIFIVRNLSLMAAYRRTLTGNEITRSPFDVYSPYQFLHKDIWGDMNYHVFTHRYGVWKKNNRFIKTMKIKEKQCSVKYEGEKQISGCGNIINSIGIRRVMDMAVGTCPICNSIISNSDLPKKVQNVLSNDGKFEYPTLIEYKNMDELRARTSQYSTIIRKEDCMDLPEKIYQPIYCEMNDEQKRIYKELKKNMFVEYNEAELTVTHKIALMVRFQQIVGGYFPETGDLIGESNPKIDALLYDLEDIDCDAPIIIWSRFTEEIEQIAKALKKAYPNKKVAKYFGGVGKKDRPGIIKEFKEGLIDFFVANPAVAGTGLNLQRAYIQYYFSNSFNAEDRWQSEDRSHRGGQTMNCLYKDIFIKGTVDDTVKKANDDKKNIAEFFKNHTVEELV